MQAMSEGPLATIAAATAREAAINADDRVFASEERRLWNATDELLEALVEASKEIGNAVKTGHNKYDKYDYGTLEDYLNAARLPLLNHGLLLVSRPVCDPQFSEATTKSDGVQQVARVLVETRVIHAKSKGWIAARCWGEGRDRGDKAIYKALTGGRKYSLAMVLGIYTTDEPENDSPPAANGERKPLARQQQGPSTPPLPPVDSARHWDAERQSTALKNMAALGPKEDATAFEICRKAAKYLLAQRANGMTPEQFVELRDALLVRGEALRVEGLISNEEGTQLVATIANSVSPTTTAAQMPGAPQPEEGAN